ncbi:DNA-binding response regulator [Siminovitchia terrae]|uniref:DNA-binding response regulator n=1 Tax=Siminovitchia terrae TaxID=1914933 RepID=A0A429X3E1_SIMTE|nr:response regulator transcription factor [Siminovitchia terrae]RST57884.1 response regulator transcription factor [Siminovitchia terrae]GIN92101.1 DNA-binding response regulator [Siminovitchia terrae]GIN98273.1 DNA-binding response regulator [Siminovitchia terrae]
MVHVLIVDDEEEMRDLISMYLQNSGFRTSEADGYDQLQDEFLKEEPDLILLDIMLPVMDGFEICGKIRENSDVPIIFLSAKGEEWDKVKGLGMGADDYIVKPFSPGELVARIDAVLRRSKFNQSRSSMEYGSFKLDEDQRKLTIDRNEIQLTFKEFELLKVMMKHPNKVFSREALLEKVWDIAYQGGLRTVDTHIKTLRMKVGADAGRYIQTVWGCGYKFVVPK